MAYSNVEQETTCVFDNITKEWNVYSCVRKHMTRLCKIADPYWKEEEPDTYGNPRMIAGKWRLKTSQVRFAKLIERIEEEEEEDGEGDAE